MPRKLAPVFRDRLELAAAADLEAALTEALGASDALIVVCSPASAQSVWVNREIEMFHAMGRGNRIFAALFDGDETDAFPPAMLHGDCGERITPLAADFRKLGDGRRLGKLKLVSVLTGVGLEALLHREQDRRIRRLTGFAGASAGLAAAFALVAVTALNAEARATREQAQSERMIETLIGDLREAVKPIGSLALLARVNETALAYYRGQKLSEMSEASLAQRARLLMAMGEDDMSRGRLATARTHFLEAHRTTSARLAQKPKDPQARFNHGQSEFWLGYAAWLSGEPEPAHVHFSRYAAIAETLVGDEPANAAWQMEAGHAAVNLGVLVLRQWGNGTAAEARFRTAIGHFDAAGRLGAERTSVDIERRNATGWLASAHRVQREYAAARSIWKATLAETERKLSATPGDWDTRRERLLAHVALLRIASESGDVRAARDYVVPALGDAKALADNDPDDSVAASDLRMVQLLAARASLDLPDRERPELRLIASQIGGCSSDPGKSPLGEVARYCTVVLAHLKLKQGQAGEARMLAAGLRPEAGSPRLSEVWGIDFDAEMRTILTAM